MQRTTLYLPDELKTAVRREAKRCGVPEAEFMRRAIGAAVSRPSPTPGLFTTDEPIAERADEFLAGFGDR